MNTISTTALSQRTANAAAFDQITSTMFAMDAILTRRPDHLKMPRQDAYKVVGELHDQYGEHERVWKPCATWLAASKTSRPLFGSRGAWLTRHPMSQSGASACDFRKARKLRCLSTSVTGKPSWAHLSDHEHHLERDGKTSQHLRICRHASELLRQTRLHAAPSARGVRKCHARQFPRPTTACCSICWG